MQSSHSRVEFDFDKFFHATVETAAVRIVQVGPIQPAAHANNEKVRHLLVEHVRPRGQDGSCGEEIVVMRNNSLMQKGILPAFLEAHEKGASEFTFRLTGLPGSLRTVETFEISKARPAAQPTLVVNNTTPPKQTSEPVIITYGKRYNSQGTDTFCLYVPAETYAGTMFAGKGFYRFSESPDGQLFFAPTDKQSELKFEASKARNPRPAFPVGVSDTQFDFPFDCEPDDLPVVDVPADIEDDQAMRAAERPFDGRAEDSPASERQVEQAAESLSPAEAPSPESPISPVEEPSRPRHILPSVIQPETELQRRQREDQDTSTRRGSRSLVEEKGRRANCLLYTSDAADE